MDITQLLLTITLSVTTIFLVIVGIQVVFVLRELRAALKRTNGIIEGFERVGMNVENGFNEVVGFFSGVKSLFRILDVVNKKKDGEQEQEHK